MVVDADGNEVFFRIKRSTQPKKLMNAYCDRQSSKFSRINFSFSGSVMETNSSGEDLVIMDEQPNDRKISKLCEYAAKNPLRIPKILSRPLLVLTIAEALTDQSEVNQEAPGGTASHPSSESQSESQTSQSPLDMRSFASFQCLIMGIGDST